MKNEDHDATRRMKRANNKKKLVAIIGYCSFIFFF